MSAAALRLPDDDAETLDPNAPGVNVERAGGVVLMSPRPARRHAHAASKLQIALSPFDLDGGPQDPGGWVIYFEPEIEIGADDLIPDLAGWRAERAPPINENAAFDTAPDWLCEVLSPRTAAFDRSDKLPAYAAWSVVHVWLVDPELRTLEVYRLDGRSYRLVSTFRGPTTVRAEPFHAIELRLAPLWPPKPR